jgi:sugar phosphate isomerase/epimerase
MRDAPAAGGTVVSLASTQRVGASMDIRYEDGLEHFAAFVAALGLEHVELRAGYLDVTTSRSIVDDLRRIAADYELTYTVHGPHLDANPGNVNEALREGIVSATQKAIDLAAEIDAGAVVIHGGSARTRYPESVREHGREQAIQTLQATVDYAADRDVVLALENQRDKPGQHRFTATPDRLASLLDAVDADPETLKLTLDVGHAKATGVDYMAFVDRFGDRIHVTHLHDNDGSSDDHDPLPAFREVAATIGAPYNVLEMKSYDDIRQCLGVESS